MAIEFSSRRAHLAVAAISAVILIAVNNGPLFWDQRAPGDFVDARFNMYVLEHLYLWLTGHENSFASPTMFFPYPDTLFFSDIHAGSAFVYAFFRAIGQSEYMAYDCWFLIGYLSTFAAAYFALARFGCGALASALGAAIFAFSLPSIAQFGHAQLVYRCGVPLALLYLWRGIREASARDLLSAFAWLCFQLLLTIYIGVFLLILMVLFAVVMPFVERGQRSPRQWLSATLEQPRRFLRGGLPFQTGFALSLVAAILLAAATIAMFAGYLRVAREYQLSRDWSEVVQMLPRPVSYLLMGPLPYWSEISGKLAASVPMAAEHNLFVGFGALGFFVVGVVAIIRNTGAARGVGPVRALGLSLVLAMALTIAFGRHNVPFYRMFVSLPGLNAIRAVSRIGIALAFPVGAIAAVGLRALVAEIKPRAIGLSIALLLAALAGFEFATMDRQSFSIAESEERVQAVIDGALERSTGISSPILLAVDPSGGNLDLQVDAMLAAQRLGWPTISGYSGNVPPGGAQFPTCALAGRQFGAYKWWRRKSHPNAPDPIEDEAALMKRVVFVGADCDDDPLNRRIVPPATDEEPTSEETPSKVTISPVSLRRAGSVIVFTVTIANQSADKWVPGRSSRRVSLSWRFVPDEGMAGDAGWDPREPLPTDIGPGASFVMSGSAALPAKPGDYRLQVSLVADGLFWFHDKGMQVLAFDEVVHVP